MNRVKVVIGDTGNSSNVFVDGEPLGGVSSVKVVAIPYDTSKVVIEMYKTDVDVEIVDG